MNAGDRQLLLAAIEAMLAREACEISLVTDAALIEDATRPGSHLFVVEPGARTIVVTLRAEDALGEPADALTFAEQAIGREPS